MTEISDLKRRVEAVGEKFGQLAEQESRYGERLSDLVNAVEEGFARSQKEVETLRGELDSARGELDGARSEIDKLKQDLEAAKEESQRRAGELESVKSDRDRLAGELEGVKSDRDRLAGELDEAKEESRQLRAMVLSLLEAVESGGTLDMGSAMRNLESRIDRIMKPGDGSAPAAAGLGVAAGSDPLEAPPAKAGSAEAGAPTPAPETPSLHTPAPETPSLETKEAPDLAAAAPEESAPRDPGVGLKDVMDEIAAIAAESAESADAAKAEEPGASDRPEVAAGISPDAAPEIGGDEAGKTAEPPSDDDLSAVNKIIQRISLLTGEFVEPSQKASGAGQDKAGSSSKAGHGPGDSAKDKPAAKSS
ncbi:MAG: hypothetical protein R3322_01810 [Kiloniellales bacterium]|nr:hypothetical protein [Kiloniellales bacterium]